MIMYHERMFSSKVMIEVIKNSLLMRDVLLPTLTRWMGRRLIDQGRIVS